MYISRTLTSTFQSSLQQFPSILITGPRQSGKSTFLQHECQVNYISFDDPLNREFALNDPNRFLDRFGEQPVILDEIQYVPELFPYIKLRIDQNRIPGKWIMTGSQQFHLMKNVSETLSGRIALLELAPFSLGEYGKEVSLEDIIWNGLFPEPACFPERRELWLKSYVQTYIERDVRQMEAIRNFRVFETFIQLCAACHAQEFKIARLAQECGVSQPTIKSWSKLLEISYLGIMLPPFFKNYGKRIIKTPKFYWSDPALVAYLTRQPNSQATLAGSMGGAFFEGLIISEVWKVFFHLGKTPSAFFWRSQSGLEVDLIIQAQGKLWPVEIKLTATPSLRHCKPLELFGKIAGEEAARGVLVCQVPQRTELPGGYLALPWREFSEWLTKLLTS